MPTDWLLRGDPPPPGTRWRHEKSGSGPYVVVGQTVLKLDNENRYDGAVGVRYRSETPQPDEPPEGYSRPLSLFLKGFTLLDVPVERGP